jgi:hypothetical protein
VTRSRRWWRRRPFQRRKKTKTMPKLDPEKEGEVTAKTEAGADVEGERGGSGGGGEGERRREK